jgi:hypothetical protein
MESMREARLYTRDLGPAWCAGPGGGGEEAPPPDPRSLEGWDEKPFPLLREQVGLSRLAHRVVPFHKSANFDWTRWAWAKRRSRPHTHTRGLPCGTSGHVLAKSLALTSAGFRCRLEDRHAAIPRTAHGTTIHGSTAQSSTAANLLWRAVVIIVSLSTGHATRWMARFPGIQSMASVLSLSHVSVSCLLSHTAVSRHRPARNNSLAPSTTSPPSLSIANPRS